MSSTQTEDDVLSPITDESLGLKPFFTLPEELPEFKEAEKQSTELSSFDPRYRDAFTGLLYIGYLKDRVILFGHSFEIQTPSQNERLEAGILHKKYVNSLSSEIGWATITVANYLRKVDDQELPQAIGPKDTGLLDRFNWVAENLKQVVIQRLYEECLILDSEVAEIMKELERVGEA